MAGLGLARPELEAAVLAWARVLVSTAWHTEVTQQPGAGVAHLHGADGPLQGELEAAPRVVEPGGAERSEEVPGPHEGGGELGDEEPHHAPRTRVPRHAARQAQQVVITEVKNVFTILHKARLLPGGQLGAGENDGVRPEAVQLVHHLPGLGLGPDLLVSQQLSLQQHNRVSSWPTAARLLWSLSPHLELVRETHIGQGQDL